MTTYVIESEKHGVYTGIDWSQSGNSYGPRFSWTIARSAGHPFFTLEEVKGAIKRIKAFQHYAWKRPSWIDDIYIVKLNGGVVIVPT